MEWIDRLNAAMRHIEENLAGEIDLSELGRIACCSSYHFQRMFTYMAGVSLSEYIRRRRMSLAAVELQSGELKVIDAAAKYGYNSPTAFNRAFQSVHGVAPSAVRGEGVALKSYPPLRFVVSVRGAQELEYRIESRPAFRIVGLSQPLHPEVEENFKIVPSMWAQAFQSGAIPRLAAMMNAQIPGLLGVSICNGQENWRYYIAVASSLPEGEFEACIVPAYTWAVFPGAGTGAEIQELERRIVTEWLPDSGYEYADGPDVEVYLSPNPADARFEVWIPVVRARAKEA